MDFFVWQRTVVDEAGNVLSSASVSVTDVVSGALAQLYSDEGVTGIGNPIAADSNGFVQFFVKSGIYTIVATSGANTRTWTKEAIGAPHKRTPAETAATITPTDFEPDDGDVRRYGWSASNTGAQNATALAAAASVWGQGGGRIHIPAGTFQLSQFTVPSGRGLIIQGEGPTQTELVHSQGGAMFVLGADNIQMFSLRDMQIEPSATTTVLLDWSGDYQAYNFEFFNVELHEGASGNTSCIGFQVVGGTNASDHQKHYFKWWGGKIFGLGTGFKLDGSVGAAANDFTAVGFQIQGCAADGILVQDSGGNFFRGSIENCGDGATNYNYRVMGSVSSENFFHGRLENTIVSANVPYYIDPAAGFSNITIATLSATPSGYNTVMAPPGCVLFDNGKEISNVERRARGFHRMLGDATTDIMFVAALATDTMGGRGRFGIDVSGRIGWSDSSAPSAWDAEFRYSAVDAAVRVDNVNFRARALEVTDGLTAPTAKGGVAIIFVDSADGDLKIRFGDGTLKTIVVDT